MAKEELVPYHCAEWLDWHGWEDAKALNAPAFLANSILNWRVGVQVNV